MVLGSSSTIRLGLSTAIPCEKLHEEKPAHEDYLSCGILHQQIPVKVMT